ncbi:hypothetical protein IWW36_000673 [Coemansia brasiliensis]|uniref:ER membrane protein complex subunit 10 n=1 Tax=Coemansia brasiliensis TaxID=2650707 RepID=A0A9W8ID34_9FUNG|nr:hypothetical protein IWW36_000673 [Coemansia brasiliensis]
MRTVYTAVVFLLLCISAAAAATEALVPAATEKFEVFHNEAADFVQRGELQIFDDGTGQYQPIGLQEPMRLADSDSIAHDDSKYTVVIRSLNNSAQFVASIKKCRLNSDQKIEETFVIHAFENGNVFHIDYDAGSSTNCQNDRTETKPVTLTRVLLKQRALGPVPKLNAAPAIDMSTGREKQPEPPKSFLAKYWYYIVPIVLLLMLGGEEPQQEGNTRRQ